MAADKPLLGIVSIAATEANNVRYIQGATKAADELGWQVNVVDAAGNADQANAAIQNFAQLKAACNRRYGIPLLINRCGTRCSESCRHSRCDMGRRSWQHGGGNQRLRRSDGHSGG